MNARRHIVSVIAVCTALAASAWTFGWLIKSSGHADRPPMFAIVAFLFAIVAGAAGLVLGVRTAKDLVRSSPEVPK